MGDYWENRYIDYLATRNGLIDCPVRLMGTDEALKLIQQEVQLEADMNNRRRRIAKKTRKAGGVRKARGK